MKEHPASDVTLRIDHLDPADARDEAAILAFLRSLGLEHLYWEYLRPARAEGDARLLAALRDRPWPPWGLQASRVLGLLHLYPIDAAGAGIGGLFVRTDVDEPFGVLLALVREGLETLAHEGSRRVSFLVRDGTVSARRVLESAGFEPGEEVFLTDRARYLAYWADAERLVDHLGLREPTLDDLLELNVDDDSFERNASFHGVLQLLQQQWVRDLDHPAAVIPNFGGLRAGYEPGTPS